MIVDLVFPVKSGGYNEELRYTLRSVCVNADGLFRDVWIVGTNMPRWLTNVRRIEAGAEGRNADIRAKVTAAATHPEVAERFVLMNDDTFLVDPITDWPAFHMGPMTEFAPDSGTSGWRHTISETADWVRTQGVEPMAWQGHRPLLWDRVKLAEVLCRYPAGRRVDVIGLYDLAGAGGTARRGINAKVKTDAEFLAKRPIRDTPWWSTNDASFRDGLIGEHIRGLFPNRCRFERT